eukprot:CAMPEP_0195586538 /NCGR_PEP_ID=MMETSP0814-20130614/29502_1 /TAXON_ID=97485 /ORGANISM="Prymnesium parvum, Strain Texoma1" /LENGTH=45 /DNA_ID= /DNA_START= /DNA_END= /DNA_ORIENTATION=
MRYSGASSVLECGSLARAEAVARYSAHAADAEPNPSTFPRHEKAR